METTHNTDFCAFKIVKEKKGFINVKPSILVQSK